MRSYEYYERLEEELIAEMRSHTGIGGLCNTDIFDLLLDHIRESYRRLDAYSRRSPKPELLEDVEEIHQKEEDEDDEGGVRHLIS